tara:strand:- start:8750 stop:8884 length:135 start_codon:yes stop_codon:yes gene_type:complete
MIKNILELLPLVKNEGKYIPIALGKNKIVSTWPELKQALKKDKI